jgi:hypothetical protein
MSQIIVDKAALMEPNLWVPFKQPTNFARLDPNWKYHKDLFYVYAPGISGDIDLVSGVMGTRTGTIIDVATPFGVATQASTSGSCITSNVGNPAGEPYSSILCVIYSNTTTTGRFIFSTRRNSSNPVYYCGVSWYTNGTTLYMQYGDDTGNTSTDLRQLSNSSAFIAGRINSMCGCFQSSTTGALFINGRSYTLGSATGSGGAVAGTGNLTIHDRWGLSGVVWNSILLLAFFNTQLPDQAMQNLSADPYQMFTPL